MDERLNDKETKALRFIFDDLRYLFSLDVIDSDDIESVSKNMQTSETAFPRFPRQLNKS